MNNDATEMNWSELIVVFNSLIRNIEVLRASIDSGELDEDDAYEAEEELNDYVTLLPRLHERFLDITDKGELSAELAKKLKEIV